MCTVASACLGDDDDTLRSFCTCIMDSKAMLLWNATHTMKPRLIQMAACMYVYKDPCTNFFDVVAADPHLAIWVAHFFRCRIDDVFSI